MSITVLLVYLVIQFVVQYIMYKPVRNLLFRIHSKYKGTIPFLKIEFFILNIMVSLFVFMFTGRGGMTGMTNTFASVLLGLCMTVDYKLYAHSISTGKYYKKLERAKEQAKRDLEYINRNRHLLY